MGGVSRAGRFQHPRRWRRLVLMSKAIGSVMVSVSSLLAGTDDPIIAPVNAWIMRRLMSDATLRVHDVHLGLIIQRHEPASVVTDFLLG